MNEVITLLNPATFIPQIGGVGIFGLIGFGMFLKYLKDKDSNKMNGNGRSRSKADMTSLLVDSQVLTSLGAINTTLAGMSAGQKAREETEKMWHAELINEIKNLSKHIRHIGGDRD